MPEAAPQDPPPPGRPEVSEQELALFVDSVRDYALFLLDERGFVRTWNEGARRIKGYEATEIIGKHFSTFYPPEEVAAGKCELELEVARREGRYREEGWRLRKDGSRFVANVTITALRDATGRLYGFGKVTQDMTDRRMAEEALRESEERFRLLVDSVPDYAIFRLDTEGRVATWNAGAQRIKGYSAAEIVGKHFSTFYPPADAASGKWVEELTRAREEGRFEEEGWRVRKDGTPFWANVILTRITNAAGKLVGFAKVTRDLTERRRAEDDRLALATAQAARQEAERVAEERARLVRQADQLNEERLRLIGQLEVAIQGRDDFLTMASHELKTPLYTLQLQVSSSLHALGPDVNERLRKRLHGAQRQVDQLTRLINALLDVSRVSARRLVLEPEPLELVAFVQALVDRDRDAIAHGGSAVELRGPVALEGEWDRLRLDQVVTNLLSNAVKYGRGQPIDVQVEARGADRVAIQVRDRGIGIDPQEHAKIFERFERAVRSESYAGFGLGLWIVRELVLVMGGTVAVESALGQGATFTVELPRHAPPPAEPPAGAAPTGDTARSASPPPGAAPGT